jgi:hypothetical protein
LSSIEASPVAAALSGTRADLIADHDGRWSITQTGTIELGPIEGIPVFDDGPPRIETFVVSADGTFVATGPNPEFAAAWSDAARSLIGCVTDALATCGVVWVAPAYLTVSATSVRDVTTTPHFDGSEYRPEDGPGVVAIAANHAGPRVAAEPILQPAVRAGLPVELDPETARRFDIGEIALQQAPAATAVMFPQFAQLHSGPHLTTTTESIQPRSLMVFRAATIPQTTSDPMPTGARRRRGR